MKLENQVTSLKLSKKLKELGVEQRSLFYYMRASVEHTDSPRGTLRYGLEGYFGLNTEGFVLGRLGIIGSSNCKEYFSAFTVAELGEMLPDYFLSCRFNPKEYLCKDIRHFFPRTKERIFGKTEANARAKMLIHIIENNLIKEEE